MRLRITDRATGTTVERPALDAGSTAAAAPPSPSPVPAASADFGIGAPPPGPHRLHDPLVHPMDRGVVEVVVDGWRFEFAVEDADRADLRARATRGRDAVGHDGPIEVRAIITGRVVSVSITQGDAVTAGARLLAVEAMKMENEVRAPRDGTVERVAVSAGETIELGDLLVVLR
jgi:biotin carboxyl carrier protein